MKKTCVDVGTGSKTDGRTEAAKLLEALREAAGDRMDILLDFHGRPSSARARSAARCR